MLSPDEKALASKGNVWDLLGKRIEFTYWLMSNTSTVLRSKSSK